MNNERPVTNAGPPDPPVFNINGADRRPEAEAQIEANRPPATPPMRPAGMGGPEADRRRRQGGL